LELVRGLDDPADELVLSGARGADPAEPTSSSWVSVQLQVEPGDERIERTDWRLSLSDPEITGSGADLGVSAAASIVAGKGDGGRRGVGNALLHRRSLAAKVARNTAARRLPSLGEDDAEPESSSFVCVGR
jgi:hypothetical protein